MDHNSLPSSDDYSYAQFLAQSQGAEALHLHRMDWLRRSRTSGEENRKSSVDIRNDLPSEWLKDDGRDDVSTYPPTYASQDMLNPETSTVNDNIPDSLHQETTKSRYHRPCNFWTIVLLFLAVSAVALTAVYSTGTAKSLMRGKLFTTSSSHSILLLRILTELCTIIFIGLGILIIEDLQWALASRPDGIGLLQFIGLDSGTGIWGLLKLTFTASWMQKFTSITRLLVLCAIPLPGIIIMGDIRIELVFFPQTSFDAAAGLADFNASLITNLTPEWATSLLVNIGNPVWSTQDSLSMTPLPRGQGHCYLPDVPDKWTHCEESYFITGGFYLVSPQNDTLNSHTEATAYVVPNTKGYQVEYGAVSDVQALHDKGNCYVLGDDSGAAYWCASTGTSQELLFGSSYCPLAVQQNNSCLQDLSWTSQLQLSTSFFVYRRTATVNYSRLNFSILSISDLSPPEPYYVTLDDMLLAMSSVFPSLTNTSSSWDDTALTKYAVVAQPINDSEVAKALALKSIRKVFAVVLHYFNANNIGGKPVWQLKDPQPGLPEDMYTTVSIAVPSFQVIAGKRSRWLFVGLSGSLLLLSLAAMIATGRIAPRRLRRSGYPTLDFAAACADSEQRSPMGEGLMHLRGQSIRSLVRDLDQNRVIAR